MRILSLFLKIGIVILVCYSILNIPMYTHAETYNVKDRIIDVPDSLLTNKHQISADKLMINLSSEDVLLEGLTDSFEFFYDVPFQGIEKDSFLHLSLQFSELLQKDSNITVTIDDLPVKSFYLDNDNQEVDTQIKLSETMVSKGFHRVAVHFNGYLSEKVCGNEGGSASWTTILSKSQLLIKKGSLSSRTDLLQDYPYPFIQNNGEKAVQSSIVIPDKASIPVLNGVMKLANYLNGMTADELIPIYHESDLTEISTLSLLLEPQTNGQV